MLLSSCCGFPPKSNGDSDTSDIGICGLCGDHCEYIDDEEEIEKEEQENELPESEYKTTRSEWTERLKKEQRLDNAWNDLGNTLREMGNEEPGW